MIDREESVCVYCTCLEMASFQQAYDVWVMYRRRRMSVEQKEIYRKKRRERKREREEEEEEKKERYV